MEVVRSAASFMDGCVGAGEAADAAETHVNVRKTCTCMHTLRATSDPHGHGLAHRAGGQGFLRFYDNKKDAQRPYDHFAGGIAPRSLLCVRKRMFSFFIKHALGGLHLEKNIQILIYFKRLPTSCRGAELTFFMLTKILIYFSRLPTSCAHLLYPSDG